MGTRSGTANLLLPLLSPLLGCGQSEQAQSWDLDRSRILAARSDPAEPQLGQTATITSYRYTPEGEAWGVWTAASSLSISPPGGDTAGDDLNPELVAALAGLEWGSLDAETQAAYRQTAEYFATEAGSGVLVLVVTDGRGGTDWLALNL